MRQLGQILNDAALTEEEFREIRTAVVKPLYVDLAGRKVLPVKKVSEGRQEYGFDVQTNAGAADVIAKATNFPGMDINRTRTLTYILKHGVSFSIAREDLLSSRQYGEALDTNMAEESSRLTQNKENTTIIQGNSLYGVNGIYSGAGNTEAGSDWGTNDPTVDIRDAMATVGSTYKMDTLLLHYDQFLQLYRRTTGTDKIYKEIIEAMGIKIIVDRDITAGTGLLMQTGKNIAELIVAEELDVEQAYEQPSQKYVFNVHLRSVPAIYQANALCKLTGI